MSNSTIFENLLANFDNYFPTANTKAQYPSDLPSNEDLGLKKGFGKTNMNSENSNIADEGPETIYIVCEKQSFRADSLYMQLSNDYNTKILYLKKKKMKELCNPMCFIIDVTTSLISSYTKSLVDYLNKYITNRFIPVFLIGDPEDLINAKRNIPFPANAVLFEFERPIDIQDCLSVIDRTLTKDTVVQKPKILVVDDSTTFLRLIQRVLEKTYDVFVATSAFDCIGTLFLMPDLPDMIILDWGLPNCSGDQLCRILKGEERTKNIPVVFYTSNCDTNDTISVMGMANGYINKNKSILDLRSYIDEWFDKANLNNNPVKI